MNNKLLFNILLIISVGFNNVYSQSYQTHKRLDGNWYYFDDNHRHQSYESSKSIQKIFLTIDNNFPDSAIFQLEINDNTSIFINDKIIDFAENPQVFSYLLDSLFFITERDLKQLTIMLFNPDKVIIKDAKIVTPFVPVQNSTLVTTRIQTNYKDALLICVLIILIILTYVKVAHADIWRAYMKWSRIMSFKDQTDAIYKLRPFEKGTLIIVLIYATLSATTIYGLFYLSKFSWPLSKYFQESYILLAILKWVGLALFLFLLAFSKYFLVKTFTRLFDFKGASRTHFYNHIRVSIVILIVLLLLELILIFGLQNIRLFDWLKTFVVISFLAKSLLISLKLIKISTYRIFHLFSYLCATELIPAIILVKITFLT